MDVAERLRQYLAAELRVPDSARLELDVPLVRGGLVDSLGLMQIVEFVETEYGIVVDETELVPRNFRDLGSIADFVERKRRTASAVGES